MTSPNLPPLLVAAGTLNADIWISVPELPQRGGRLMTDGFKKFIGGMSANLACAAAALGPPLALRAELIAPVGPDADGRWLTAELQQRNVSTDWLDRSAAATSACVILVEPGGERSIISEPTALDVALIERRLRQTEGGLKLVHGEGLHAAWLLDDTFALARRLGWRTSIDIDELPPALQTRDCLAALSEVCDTVFINRGYCARLLGDDPERWRSDLSELARRFGTTFLLTLGEGGAVLIEQGVTAQTIPAAEVAVVDTTGAGDVFAGVFLGAWLNGLSKPEAARNACRAASLSTTAEGALGYLPDARTVTNKPA